MEDPKEAVEQEDVVFAFGFVPDGFSANGILFSNKALESPMVTEAIELIRAAAVPWRDGYLIDLRNAVLNDRTTKSINRFRRWAESSYLLEEYDWAENCETVYSESPTCNQMVEEFETKGIKGYYIVTEIDPETVTSYNLRCWWSDTPEARTIVEQLLSDIGFEKITLSSSNYGHISTLDKKLYDLCKNKKFKFEGVSIIIDR